MLNVMLTNNKDILLIRSFDTYITKIRIYLSCDHYMSILTSKSLYIFK